MPTYSGSDTQPVNDRVAADRDYIPAYRGTAIHVVEDLQLEEFGNRIPNFQYEVHGYGELIPFQNIYTFEDPLVSNSQIFYWKSWGITLHPNGLIRTGYGHTNGSGSIVASQRYANGTKKPTLTSTPSNTGITFAYNSGDYWLRRNGSYFNIYNLDGDAMFANSDSYGLMSSNYSGGRDHISVANFSNNAFAVGENFFYVIENKGVSPRHFFLNSYLRDESGLADEEYQPNIYGVVQWRLDLGELIGSTNSNYAGVRYDSTTDRLYLFDWRAIDTVSPLTDRTVTIHELDVVTLEIIRTWEGMPQSLSEHGDIRDSLVVGGGSGVTRVWRLHDDETWELVCEDSLLDVQPTRLHWLDDGLLTNGEHVWAINQPAGGGIPLNLVVEDLCDRAGIPSADVDATNLSSVTVLGYSAKGVKSLREHLEQLMQAYQFDVYEDDYKLKFALRDSASVVTVTEDDMRPHPYGSDGGQYIQVEQIEESKLPHRVNVNYLNATAGYEADLQFFERAAGSNKQITDLRFEMAFTPEFAVQLADKLLREAWVSRTSYSFSLPKKYSYLSPTNVITLDTADYEVDARLIEVGLGIDGRLLCKAVQHSFAVYTSEAETESPETSEPNIYQPATQVILALIDTNAIDTGIGLPLYFAGTSSTFKGFQLQRSSDGGDTWQDIGSFQADAAMMGYVETAIGEPHPDLIGRFDPLDELTVKVYRDDVSFSSKTELQICNGQNIFAVGAPGRWELIGVKTVTQVDDFTYTFSGLIRGLNGTEGNIGTMENQDTIVLLNESGVGRVGLSEDDIGSTYVFRASFGSGFPDASFNQSVAITGAAYKDFAPSNIVGEYRSNGDIRLSWTRRTFKGGAWRDGVDVALAPTSTPEEYTVRVYDNASPRTLIRTISSISTNTTTYSAAEIASDMSPYPTPGSLVVEVVQINSVTGEGYVGEGVI